MGEVEYHELIASNPRAAAKMLVEKDRQIEKLRTHLMNAAKARFGKKAPLDEGSQETIFPWKELVTAPEAERDPKGYTSNRYQPRPGRDRVRACGGNELVTLRTEVTKILNYIPATIEIKEHHRPVMACARCSPVNTPLSKGIPLIPRSPAGVGLLTSIPLFQSTRTISRSTARR
jgi:hypothetical protein